MKLDGNLAFEYRKLLNQRIRESKPIHVVLVSVTEQTWGRNNQGTNIFLTSIGKKKSVKYGTHLYSEVSDPQTFLKWSNHLQLPTFFTLAFFEQSIPNSVTPLSPFKNKGNVLKHIQTNTASHLFHYIVWYFISFPLDESTAVYLSAWEVKHRVKKKTCHTFSCRFVWTSRLRGVEKEY